jgi:hypothetical protein
VTEKVGRRALLRRAATVAAAGIGGIAATEMLTASPANAAAGDPMVLGPNNGTTARTTLTSAAATGSTFEVSHSAKIANVRLAPVDDSVDYGGPTNPQGDPNGTMLGGELINLTETVDTGTGTADVDTLFWMAGDNSTSDLANLAVVLTTATGTVFAPYAYTDSNGVPIGPFRVLDTRSNRTRLATQTVLDSSHRLIGGKTLELQLDEFVKFAYAVHINLTAVTPTGGGFLTAFGSQDSGGLPLRPTASNVNYSTGVTIANHTVSPLSDVFSLYIYASKTTHVLVDVQGWTLPDFSFLNVLQAKAGALRATTANRGLGVVPGPMPRRTTGG